MTYLYFVKFNVHFIHNTIIAKENYSIFSLFFKTVNKLIPLLTFKNVLIVKL